MTRVESIVLLAGMALLAIAAAAVDLRLGLATAGLFLIVSTVDIRGVRR